MSSDADEYENEYDEVERSTNADDGGASIADSSSTREQPLNINEEIAPSVVKSSSIEDTDPGTDEPNPADEVNPDEEDGDDDEGVDPSIAIGDSRAEDTVLSALDSGGPAPSRTLKAKPRRQTADALRVQKLGRQLNQSRKINSELRNQLQQLYRNDAIAQLENRAKEKQARIDDLTQENRLLKQQERVLHKELEDLQESKGSFPTERRALLDEMRVYKDKIRMFKDQRKASDEKLTRLHQQVVDFTTKNKLLQDRVRQLEEAATASKSAVVVSGRPVNQAQAQEIESVIANQEEEITRLQQRVALMKKTAKADKLKWERLVKTSQDEVELAREQLDAFQQQVFQREKTSRAQFLQLKALKRTANELAMTHQSNHHLQQLLTDRDVRFANGRNPHSHARPVHQIPSPRQGNIDYSAFAMTSPRLRAPGQRLYDTLLHLGYVPSLGRAPGTDEAGGDPTPEVSSTASAENIEFVQGKIMPCPPAPSLDGRKHNFVGSGSGRAQFYTTRSTESLGKTEVAMEDKNDLGSDIYDPSNNASDNQGSGYKAPDDDDISSGEDEPSSTMLPESVQY